MSKKILVKQILELRAAGLSQNNIARSRHMSKSSVSDVFQIAQERGISFESVKAMRPEEVYTLFYPNKHAEETLFEEPDYEYIHKELSRVGVTLKLLWKEYKDKCAGSKDGIPVGYTKFCTSYTRYTVTQNLTNHLIHKPGVVVEVDWSGPTMKLVDRATGEIIDAHLFVATLPYSQYTYVEPCINMKEATWLNCHVHMFEFFGGTTARAVCDNLKTGVVKHPREGDIILNESYEALGNHYSTAIMPAQVRKPKQKASVEGTIGKIATAIIARLRNEVFYSMDTLKAAVAKALKDFNDEPFQKRSGSRSEIFLQEEKTSLRPLSGLPYEISDWIYDRKVNLDCHVVFKKNHYSCPYQYVGKQVDLKVTESLVEIFHQGKRLAAHLRFPDYTENGWSTHSEDMPDRFQQMEWDDQRIQSWAESIGVRTALVIKRIFENVNIKEQGYNSCLSVLRLSKSYTKERLEGACALALTKFRSPRYRHLKAILAANEDIIYLNSQKKTIEEKNTVGYVRGAAYYGGHHND
jgi:transposase